MQIKPRVLLKSLSSSEKWWGLESHYKLQHPQRIHPECLFQDGGDAYYEKHSEAERLLQRWISRTSILYPKLCFLTQYCQFQINWLPLSHSWAPWVFAKSLKPVISTQRVGDKAIVVCIKDIVVMEESKDLARDHIKALLFLLKSPEVVYTQRKQSQNHHRSWNFLEWRSSPRYECFSYNTKG